MATDPEFIAFAKDLFSELGPLKTTRMFGGTGLYTDGAMFAALLNGTIYMKADPPLAAEYLAAGSTPFSFMTKDGLKTTPGLTSLPESALDDPEEALGWARKSLVPALAAAEKRKLAKTRKGK